MAMALFAMRGDTVTPAKVAMAAKYYRLHGRPDLADRLEAELLAAGRCRRCGRRLTDPTSLVVGLGSECRRRKAS